PITSPLRAGSRNFLLSVHLGLQLVNQLLNFHTSILSTEQKLIDSDRNHFRTSLLSLILTTSLEFIATTISCARFVSKQVGCWATVQAFL
ncbi:MAG: hypothetical protein ACK532_18960, partial [Acidobacteriota bacterium]